MKTHEEYPRMNTVDIAMQLIGTYNISSELKSLAELVVTKALKDDLREKDKVENKKIVKEKNLVENAMDWIESDVNETSDEEYSNWIEGGSDSLENAGCVANKVCNTNCEELQMEKEFDNAPIEEEYLKKEAHIQDIVNRRIALENSIDEDQCEVCPEGKVFVDGIGCVKFLSQNDLIDMVMDQDGFKNYLEKVKNIK